MTIQGQIFIQITEHNLIEIKIYIQNTRNKNNVGTKGPSCIWKQMIQKI